MKYLKKMIDEIRQEEEAKAKAKVYREIVRKHPDTVNSEIEVDYNQALKDAMAAQKSGIKRMARLELEETARLSGCNHPDLLATALQDHLEVGEQGELLIVDPASRTLLRDHLTGRLMGVDDLLNKARHNPDYSPLFTQPSAGTSPNQLQNVKNPWKKETLNLTRQAQMLRENPTLAEAMKEAAQE